MTSDTAVLHNAMVIVRNERIEINVPIPAGAEIIDGGEKWDIMTPYVANGITTLLELNSRPEHFGQRNDIAKGSVIGPRMALAALINGGGGSGRVVNTASDGRQAVRSAKAEGYEFIKLYSGLNVETFQGHCR